MNAHFSPQRSYAIRQALEEHVTAHRPHRTRFPRWVPGLSLLVAGLLTGGAVSAAAVTALREAPTISSTPIAAPPGVTPGQPIISLLGNTTSVEITGSTVLDLPDPPAGATHLRVTFTCLSADTFRWGPDQEGINPSSGCSAPDLGTSSATAWFDFELDESTTTLTITAPNHGRALLALQYLNYVPTSLGRNAAGETFGVGAGDGVEPDLVAVVGIDANGEPVEGYARSSDLNAFGPDRPDQPSNPDEAMEWQRQREERYPSGWDIPVFESDGTTKIGTFHIG
jgi:hypothetical protein